MNISLSLDVCRHDNITAAKWHRNDGAGHVHPQQRGYNSRKPTYKDDANAPHIRFAWIVAAACEDFRRQVRVAAYNAGCLDQACVCMWRWGVWLGTHVSHSRRVCRLGDTGSVGDRATHVGARICKDDCGAKVDEFDNIATGKDAVVEFEVAMGETEGVEISNTVADLAKDTENLWAKHLGGHDDGEEVIRSVLHDLLELRWAPGAQGDTYLVVVAMIADDVDGLDDIDVLEASANAKLGAHFLFVLALGLTCATGTELFDGVYCASGLCTAADETDGSPST